MKQRYEKPEIKEIEIFEHLMIEGSIINSNEQTEIG